MNQIYVQNRKEIILCNEYLCLWIWTPNKNLWYELKNLKSNIGMYKLNM